MSAVVVGAGISGLAAAWELSRTMPGADITVIDADSRTGGKIKTTAFLGHAVDEGADAFLARLPEAVGLARELGLGDDLVSPATGQASLWIGGSLVPIPGGHVLGVPTDIDLVARSGILSDEGVARARQEPELPGDPLGADEDVAVGDLIARRYGREVQERLVDPLLGGINAGRSEELSIEIGAAQIAAAARRDASLTRGLLAMRAENPPDPTAPVFHAPSGGMQRLVDALTAALQEKGVTFRLGTPVTSLGTGAGPVIVATPAWAAAPLIEPLAPDVASALAAIEYASVALVTLAYRRRDLPAPLTGSGFLVPRVEGRFLTAGSVFSNKWPAMHDDDHVIIRASTGKAGNDTAMRLDDRTLLDRVHNELAEALGIEGDPVETRISRWPRAFPQFKPGHRRTMNTVHAALAEQAPGFALCGAYVGGVGIPACIASAVAAVARLT